MNTPTATSTTKTYFANPLAKEILELIDIGTTLKASCDDLNAQRIDAMNTDAEEAQYLADQCRKSNAQFDGLIANLQAQTGLTANTCRALCDVNVAQRFYLETMREIGCAVLMAADVVETVEAERLAA